MRYLSGAPYLACIAWKFGGFMAQPGHSNTPATCAEAVWAADNGCYTMGDHFDDRVWLRWLAQRQEFIAQRGRCLFAVLPDVPFDHDATLARSLPYVMRVRALGYPVALAIQNGASVGHVPWDDLDAVFIAGDKAFKTSATAWAICREAQRRGLHVHIARRNSKRAMQAAYDMGADSVDGTFLAFAPDHNWERMQRWFAEFCRHDEVLHWADDTRFGRCVTCGADVWRVVGEQKQVSA